MKPITIYFILIVLFKVSCLNAQSNDIDYSISYKFTLGEPNQDVFTLNSSVEHKNTFISDRSLKNNVYYVDENFYDPINKFTWQFKDEKYGKSDVDFFTPQLEDVFITSNKRYAFRIPETIKKGDILQYNYSRKYRSAAYFPAIYIPNLDCIKKFIVIIEHPDSIKPKFNMVFSRDSFQYKILSSPERTYFEAGPLSFQKPLDYFPFNNLQALIIVSFEKNGIKINPTTYKEFSDWYGTLTSLEPALTDSNRSILKEEIKKAGTKTGKLKVIYDFIRNNFRYIAEEQDSCSIIPRAPSIILGKRYADCKERAALLSAIAREYGIKVNLVLVPSDDVPDTENAFVNKYDHMICSYQAETGILFFDPTSQYCEFGNLPDSDIGKKVLILDKDKPFTTIIPSPNNDPSVEVEIYAAADSLNKGIAKVTLRNDYFSAGLHAKNELTGVKLENFLSSILTSSLYKISLDYFEYEKEDSSSITFKAAADISHFVISSVNKMYVPKTPFIFGDNSVLKRGNDKYCISLGKRTVCALIINLVVPGMGLQADALTIGSEESQLYFKAVSKSIDSNKLNFSYKLCQFPKEFFDEEKLRFVNFCETYLNNKTNMFIIRGEK